MKLYYLSIIGSLLYLQLFPIQMNGLQKSYKRIQRSFLKMKEADVVQFGDNLPLLVNIPMTKLVTAQSFIQNPKLIIDETWDKDKVTQIDSNRYRLKFITIPFLQITPSIVFDFKEENGAMTMQSTDWNVPGLEKFDFSLIGSISVESDSVTPDSVTCRGYVKYNIAAATPSVLRSPPLLDGTISFIKSGQNYISPIDTFHRIEYIIHI